jgi:hypothetical protein
MKTDIICRSMLLRMRNVTDKFRRENLNTHFLLYKYFENRAVHEICGIMRYVE